VLDEEEPPASDVDELGDENAPEEEDIGEESVGEEVLDGEEEPPTSSLPIDRGKAEFANAETDHSLENNPRKKYRKCILGGCVLIVVVALAVALGVTLGSGGDGNDGTAESSSGESSGENNDEAAAGSDIGATPLSPTASALSTTMSPSYKPTEQLSLQPEYSRPCFVDRDELKPAVDEYTTDGL
jgi:hypothetical protein